MRSRQTHFLCVKLSNGFDKSYFNQKTTLMYDTYILISMFGIALAYSLGFKTISAIAASLLFIIPAVAFCTIIFEHLFGINFYYSIVALAFTSFILGYFFIEFPMSEEYNNKLYIERIEWSNKTLEDFKDSDYKTEAMIHWIGDGTPLETPIRISKFKELLNRFHYYVVFVIFNHLKTAYNYLLWHLGRGGQVGYYNGKFAHTLLNKRKPEAMCEDVNNLIRDTKSIKFFKESYIISLIAYFLLIATISDFFDDGFFIYSLKSIILLGIFSLIFQKFLRRYVDENNVKFNLFRKYQEEFAKHGKQIGFTYVNVKNDINNSSLKKLSVRAVNPKKNPNRTQFVHSDRWHDYFVVPYGINFSSFHKLLPFIQDMDEHIRFIKVIKESELK